MNTSIPKFQTLSGCLLYAVIIFQQEYKNISIFHEVKIRKLSRRTFLAEARVSRVLILYGSSEHGAHIWFKPGVSIC